MLPTFYGSAARQALVALWGLPNVAPLDGESVFATKRELFVDDDEAGMPVAFWEP